MPHDAKTFAKPSSEELRRRLSPLQYEVTQNDATEPPFRNEFWDNHEDGLYVDVASPQERLFIQQVSRVKATYTFTSRLFVRAIGQYVATTRDPSLYTVPVDPRSGDFSGSALFAYKLNWQSVLFIGYGDSRELTTNSRLAPVGREFFTKISYAFQR